VAGFAWRQLIALFTLLWDMARALWPQQWLVQTWRRIGNKRQIRVKLLLGAVLLTSPIWLLNLAVAFFGNSVVFPLSPYFLREKAAALAIYAAHRPLCWLRGHPDIEAEVARAEARQHLPRALLAAIVHVESGGHPHRISSAGAMGPGQLMPSTARLLGVGDPFDTAANVDGAARLLADHLDRYHGNIRLAVAAYNAGPGAVRGRVPDNGQTPAYVAKVLAVRSALRTLDKVAPRRLAMMRLARADDSDD
jgi:soluble lytic murein transglycosylase-like protein